MAEVIDRDDGQRFDVVFADTGERPILPAELAPGLVAWVDASDPWSVTRCTIDPVAVEPVNVHWLLGCSIGDLIRGGVVDVGVNDEWTVGAAIARLALVQRFVHPRYRRTTTEGLWAAERLALLDHLADRGLAPGRSTATLAESSVAPLLRWAPVPDRGRNALHLVRAAARHLPDDAPGGTELRRLLQDEPDASTLSLWMDLERAAAQAERTLEFRSPTGAPEAVLTTEDLALGRRDEPSANTSWDILWPLSDGLDYRSRPTAAETQELARTSLAVVVRTDSPGDVRPVCVRAVSCGAVVAFGGLFQSPRGLEGTLYLPHALTGDDRIEIVTDPHAPVPTATEFRQAVERERLVGAHRDHTLGIPTTGSRDPLVHAPFAADLVTQSRYQASSE